MHRRASQLAADKNASMLLQPSWKRVGIASQKPTNRTNVSSSPSTPSLPVISAALCIPHPEPFNATGQPTAWAPLHLPRPAAFLFSQFSCAWLNTPVSACVTWFALCFVFLHCPSCSTDAPCFHNTAHSSLLVLLCSSGKPTALPSHPASCDANPSGATRPSACGGWTLPNVRPGQGMLNQAHLEGRCRSAT